MKCQPAAVRSIVAVLLLVAIMTGVSGCVKNKNPGSTSAPLNTSVSVPAVYQQLYTQLGADMESYNSSLAERSPTYPRPAYGAELLPANGNRGEDLLKPENRAGTVAYLDRLKEMGVQGVTIAMPYPMYMPGSARHDDYVAYYKQVFDEIRKRGMIAEVETGVIFAGTAFSPVRVDFDKLTFEQYKADKKRMTQAIIDDLHPDYLDLGAEPDTEYKLTGWSEFNSPAKYAGYVRGVLDGLAKGGTKIGVGIGSWGSTAYVDEYAKIGSLDFIAVHVYPAEPKFLKTIDTVAGIARANGKAVVMDECWLYKTKDYSQGMASSEDAFKRDADAFKRNAYSFWAPLDQQFLALMDRSARVNGIEYMSPFWANFFFAYVDYDSSMDAGTYGEVVAQANRAAAGNIVADTYSPTGEYYRSLIAGTA